MNRGYENPKVIHEDNHIIVINKPPLLATMGVQADEDSLVKWTKSWIKQKYQKPGNVYLGVVSRLDAFTSGIVVLARTSKAAGRMTRQFQSGEVEKGYTAVLEGCLEPLDGKLIDWIRKDDARRRMVVAQAESKDTRRAELDYQVTGRYQDQTLVSIQLLTGRKHQIRVQFASRGLPVLGDRKYGGTGKFGPGIALHSSLLCLEHPVKRVEMKFQLEPPKHWNLWRFANI